MPCQQRFLSDFRNSKPKGKVKDRDSGCMSSLKLVFMLQSRYLISVHG